jgi:hypothetical protein
MSDVKNATDAIEALRQVVTGREGYVYPGARFSECFNFVAGYTKFGVPTPHKGAAETLLDDGNLVPSCIVGHVLALWGLDRELWGQVEGNVYSIRIPLHDLAAEDKVDFKISAECADVLGVAQLAQDRGVSWDTALQRAEEYYRNKYGKEDGDV